MNLLARFRWWLESWWVTLTVPKEVREAWKEPFPDEITDDLRLE